MPAAYHITPKPAGFSDVPYLYAGCAWFQIPELSFFAAKKSNPKLTITSREEVLPF
jgi:hypothetical protein